MRAKKQAAGVQTGGQPITEWTWPAQTERERAVQSAAWDRMFAWIFDAAEEHPAREERERVA